MLEREGKQGLTILVEGIRTGSAKVLAKLSDPVYKVMQGGHGTGNLAINFSRQGKHREFKEFNKNTGNGQGRENE